MFSFEIKSSDKKVILSICTNNWFILTQERERNILLPERRQADRGLE
jgi:hypothetical protein